MTATDEARARELLLRAERLHEMEGSDFAIAAIAQALEAVRRETVERCAQEADLLLGATMAQSSVGKAIRSLLPATKEGGNGG